MGKVNIFESWREEGGNNNGNVNNLIGLYSNNSNNVATGKVRTNTASTGNKVATGKVRTTTTPAAPVTTSYKAYTTPAPVYTSPTAGAQYSYNVAAPTWGWNDPKPTYTSQYQDQINSMVDAILNRQAFSYDYNTDPLYAQYKDAYTRNGTQAMNDTMAKMAARTGGLASSFAGTAAQQTYNGYMDALNDKVPELYNMAYGMYMDEGNRMRNDLNMVQGLEDTNYGRYMDELGQWNTDRGFSYNQYRDTYDDWYNERNYNYNLWQDNLARQEAAAQAAYNAALANWEAGRQSYNAYNAAQDAPKNMSATTLTEDGAITFNGNTFNNKDSLFNYMASQGWSASRLKAEMQNLLKSGVITQQEYNRFIDAQGG